MPKHSTKQCPQDPNVYQSRKSKAAMLLLAIVDARARIPQAHFGAPGCCRDAGVWNHSHFTMYKLERGGLLRTPAAVLSVRWAGQTVEKVIQPFLVGDGAFEPSTHMQKCYPDCDGFLPAHVFNRVLCDTRKVVEMAVSRLNKKWRSCHKDVCHNDVHFV
jgi:hypothetical protein